MGIGAAPYKVKHLRTTSNHVHSHSTVHLYSSNEYNSFV